LSGPLFRSLVRAQLIPALADGTIIHEISDGVSAHDVLIWSRSPVESGVSLNGEIAFGLLAGTIRPAAGGGTLFYVDARIAQRF
jgi:hypothetical protein